MTYEEGLVYELPRAKGAQLAKEGYCRPAPAESQASLPVRHHQRPVDLSRESTTAEGGGATFPGGACTRNHKWYKARGMACPDCGPLDHEGNPEEPDDGPLGR